MDSDTFDKIVTNEATGKLSRRRSGLALIEDIQRTSPERWETFLSALRSGASYKAAAGLIGVAPETITRWMERGRGARSGPYKRFFRAVMKSLQEATAIAEVQVAQKNPENWLRNGPGKLVNPEWREDGKKVEVEVSGEVATSGKLTVAHVDVVAAMRELKAAGVSLDMITMEQHELPKGVDAEDGDDGETLADKSGTNYVGDGLWVSDNPSLPLNLQQNLTSQGVIKTKVNRQVLEDTNGEVVVPVKKDWRERLKGLA